MTDVSLSPRMHEVVQRVAGQGMSYPEVADDLGIAPTTVKKYAREIGDRLRMEPRKAIFWYYQNVVLGSDEAA